MEKGQRAASLVRHLMPIQGLVTPAFIHNGGHHFINLPVYENGLVDCWQMLDLPLFRAKLESGWVTASVPDGGAMSVHGLALWTVERGRWHLTQEDFFRRVQDLIDELNPERHNLYVCHGTTIDELGEIRGPSPGISAQIPFRREKPEQLGSRMVKGRSISGLVETDGELYLADLRVFSDGRVQVGRVPNPMLWTLEELDAAAHDGVLRTVPAKGQRVYILGLGSFELAAVRWSADLADLLRDVRDKVESSSGRPTSVQRCRAAYERYLHDPTAATKRDLQEAYEAIPAHDRPRVGDMDTKDIPVRMIIYGDQEIERWSHRAVARARGERLPTITVPKPRDEE